MDQPQRYMMTDFHQDGLAKRNLGDDELAALASDRNALMCIIGSHDRPTDVATRLYATLRDLDAARAHVVLVHEFSDDGLGAAVQDRLRRAAERVKGDVVGPELARGLWGRAVTPLTAGRPAAAGESTPYPEAASKLGPYIIRTSKNFL